MDSFPSCRVKPYGALQVLNLPLSIRFWYKRAWAEYWERIHQGCPWEQAIGEMCATYGGVARKHPQLVLNAFYNHMYGQIIDWALEAMNVEPDKSD